MKVVQTVRRMALSHTHTNQLTFCYSNGPKIDNLPRIPQQYEIGPETTPRTWYSQDADEEDEFDSEIFENINLYVQPVQEEYFGQAETEEPLTTMQDTQGAINMALVDSQATQGTMEASFGSNFEL
jgi:hypothetical protein